MNKSLFLLIIILLCTVSLMAQSLPIRNYSTQNGLAQNQVHSVLQDSKGFMWFRTQAGLSRFDGYNFLNISMNEGLPSNYIKNFYQIGTDLLVTGNDFVTIIRDDKILYNFDSDYFNKNFNDTVINTTTWSDTLKTVLYAFSRDAIYKLIIEKDNFVFGMDFKKIVDTNIFPEEININSVFSMLKEDILYVDMIKDSYFIDFSSKKVELFLSKMSFINNPTVTSQLFRFALPDDYFLFIYQNQQDDITELHRFDLKNKSLTKIYSERYIAFIYEVIDNVTYYAKDENDNYMFINNKGEIFSVDIKEAKYFLSEHRVFSEDNELAQISDCFLIDHKIWILTNTGLIEYDKYNSHSQLYTVINGLSSLNLNTMFVDRESNIWLGTNGSGVDMIVTSNVTNYTDKNGLSHTGTTNTLVGDDGSIWVTTDNGVSRIMQNGQVKHYFTKDGLTHQDTWSLAKDSKGNILVGTLNNGINMFKNNKFIDVRPKNIPPTGIYTSTMFLDSDNNIWVPAYFGLIVFDENYNHKYLPFEHSRIIYKIAEDNEGHIWIAGSEKKIDILSKNGTLAREINFDNNVFTSNVVSFHFVNEQIVWLFTYGDGIVEYNQANNTFKKILQKEFLGAEIMKAHTVDKQGNVWVGTINGVYKIANDLKVTRFSEEDGLVGNDIRTSGAYCDDNGILWFNSTFGLIRINPQEEYIDTNPPLTYITEFSMKKNIDLNLKSNNVFPYNDNSAFFRYVGLEFRNPHRILYQYYLLGFDDDWSDFTQERYIRYTNLNPGSYKFMVRSIDNAGNLSEVASVDFLILPPFWKTWWFRFLSTIILTLVVWAFIRWRIKALERRNQELEEEVAERTKELQEKNDQIISSIRYAKRIQQAILPQESFLQTHFAETFVIYKPRDIIAGDYYWFSEIQGYTFLAVADCTGHGVPGALLSIVGNMLLNEIINKHEIYDPAKILEHLHENVRNVLCQNQENSYSNDGMEVCICRFSEDYKELAYAGANRPLYIVRDKHLQQINGDRKGIGGKQREDKRTFTTHTVELHNHDMLYLSTDGFVDQANSEDKKFGSRRLKHLLQYIAEKKTDEQLKILVDNFSSHSENEAQRDDVTLIGIRIELKGDLK